MRLSFSALLLSTALAPGFGAGAITLFAPPAQAQAVALQAGEVDVDQLLALLPAGVKGSYGSKSFDAASGVTTVRDLKIVDAANEAQNFVAVQEIGLRGVDLAAFKHVFDFASYGATPDESFKQLFGDILVKNVSFTANGQNVGALEELVLGGVQMKQLAHKPPGGVTLGGDNTEGAKFFGALLDSAITGEIKVTNLTMSEGDNRASMKSLVFGGINRGQFGASSIEQFESSADGMTSKIQSATADGADFTKVIPWLLKGEMPPIGPDALLYFGAASVNGLSYDMDGTTVTFANYTIEPINFYWLVPSSLKVSLTDMYVKPAADDADGLAELGLDHIDLDIGIEWAFDGAGGNASLKELRFAESQLLDARLSLDLVGINLAQLIDPATAQSSLFGVGLTGAQLFIKNNGGFDKFLAAAAREEGSTPEALKQTALDQLTQIESGMPQPDGTVKPLTDRLKAIVASFKAFINSPGTLTIKVQPATPITAATGMGALFDPISAADTLGVTVEATPQ